MDNAMPNQGGNPGINFLPQFPCFSDGPHIEAHTAGYPVSVRRSVRTGLIRNRLRLDPHLYEYFICLAADEAAESRFWISLTVAFSPN